MSSTTPISRLHWRVLLFPLALVAFEFCTYIANDMILPGMLQVTREFGAGPEYVPLALSAYLLGGILLQWLLGPLSDRIGRRPVMLFGVACFTVSCLATLFVQSIEQFFILRIIQGTGLGFISVVGYATVQETFDERTAIQVIALMANVALIAPLIGPLAGAIVIAWAPWRTIFIMVAVLAFIALLGLYRTMPEPQRYQRSSMTPLTVWRDYRAIFSNARFIFGAIACGLAPAPVLAWIGLSPVLLMQNHGLSALHYGVLQIPIFTMLILGNIVASRWIGKVSAVERVIITGRIPLCTGLIFAFSSSILAPDNYGWLVMGMSIYTFGLSLSNGTQIRLTLFSSTVSKGTVSAAFSMTIMPFMAVGIEVASYGYKHAHTLGFTALLLLFGLLSIASSMAFLKKRHQFFAQTRT